MTDFIAVVRRARTPARPVLLCRQGEEVSRAIELRAADPPTGVVRRSADQASRLTRARMRPLLPLHQPQADL